MARISLMILVVGFVTLSTAANAQDEPIIDIQPLEYDFGGLYIANDFQQAFTLTNIGNVTVDNVWFGPNLSVPLSGNPQLATPGGGVTVGLDQTRVRIGNWWCGPQLSFDAVVHGFTDDEQLNQAGNLVSGDREGKTGFAGLIRPGLMARRGLCDRANAFVNAGGVLGYHSSDNKVVTFDPGKTQVPVDEFKTDSFVCGFYGGGGLELLFRGTPVQIGVNATTMKDDLYTGRDKTSTSLMFIVNVHSSPFSVAPFGLPPQPIDAAVARRSAPADVTLR